MNLKKYAENLLSNFKDSRTLKNIESLLIKIKENKSLKIWSVSENRADYERSKRLLDGSLNTLLDDKKIRDALKDRTVSSLIKNDSLILLHDPCDLRKEHSKKLEDIGKVRALNGKIINGYSTFNTVVVDHKGMELRLLDTEFYSNREDNYVSSSELKSPDKLSAERSQKVKNLIKEENYINLFKITCQQLKKSSESFKLLKPEIVLCHVLDRGFDGNNYFGFIDGQLKDNFVIRLKASRLSDDRVTKLTQSKFSDEVNIFVEKVMIKSKVYQDVTVKIEANTFESYKVVRVTLSDRNVKNIFREPMLLITNLEIENTQQLINVYETYLMRSKIESVFKFLKSELGWEDFQQRDFESIKNIVTLAYFIAGYFYEIEKIAVDNKTIKWLAQLGKGKGKVTRHFILLGLVRIIHFQEVQKFINDNNLSHEEVDEMLSYARVK